MPDFELFRLFQSGMILQRDCEVSVWGFARPGVKVCVKLDDTGYEAVTDAEGEFEVKVRTGNAGGPHNMVVYNESGRVDIDDILYGDVYMISGQSNMQLPVERTIDLIGSRLPDINLPEIREFRVPEKFMFGEVNRQFDECRWYKAVLPDLPLMSATGFNFAENIYNNEGIPVGLINNSIGGTPIEAHLPEEVLRRIGGYEKVLDKCKDKEWVLAVIEADNNRINDWNTRLYMSDPGYVNDIAVFAAPEYDDTEWQEINVPVFFGDMEIGDYHGSVWFRKRFDIPEGCNTDGALLRLGTLIDADTTYINGVKVGETGYMYPPRRYQVPDGVLKTGTNVVAVRLTVNRNTGGFTPGKRYCLQGSGYIYEGGYNGQACMPADAAPAYGRWEIDLSGAWKYTLGYSMEELPMQTFFIYKPSALYNGMMYALRRIACVGGLWYQGESNDSSPIGYAGFMKELISCWREWFGDIPFIYVGLPQFDDPARVVARDSWAIIREEQRRVLTEVDNTAMAVTIDVGEANDLHPQTKAAVGKRLALAAEALVYGRDIEYSGPEIVGISYNEDDNTLSLKFSHCSSGIKAVNDNSYFELGYSDVDVDNVYDPSIDWVNVPSYTIDGNDGIILENKYNTDRKPAAVRYCFDNCPDNPPVYNGEGLPAIPFAVLL